MHSGKLVTEKAGYHHGDLESALLSQARILVVEQGADHESMREVASRIGVSPSAVYHHFADRDSLLTAVGREVFAEMAAFQERAKAEFIGKSVAAIRKRFRALGFAYVEYAKANPHLFRLCFGPLCSGDSEMDKSDNPAWNLLVNGLDEMASVGLVHPKVRPNAELLVWSTIHGCSMLTLDGLLPPDAVSIVIDALELTLKGVSQSEKGKK